VQSSRDHNAKWRAWLTEQVDALGNHGLRVVPSHANFILVLFEGSLSAEQAHEQLAQHGYAVRWLPGQGLTHGLRITIGSEEQNRGLMNALRQIAGAA